jgi:hypothetical protein
LDLPLIASSHTDQSRKVSDMPFKASSEKGVVLTSKAPAPRG